MNSKFVCALGLTVTGTLLSASIAVAEVDWWSVDAKRYSGAECGASNHSDLMINDKGQALNKSSSKELRTVCPIENDKVMGLGLDQVRIWLQKANNTDTMCWVHASRPSQQGGYYEFDFVSMPGRSVPVDINSPITGNVPWIGDVHYVLGCDTAPRKTAGAVSGTAGYSGINSFWTVERL